MIGTTYVHWVRANVRLRGCSDPFPAGMRCPYHTFPIEGPLLSLPCPASLGSTLARMAAANPTTPSLPPRGLALTIAGGSSTHGPFIRRRGRRSYFHWGPRR